VDLLVLRRLTREIVAADVPPRFRLLHLFGAHVPASLDRDCEFAGTKARPENSDREPFVEATRCLLSRVFAYLQALDEAGLYDASAVLVISDHGHLVPLDPSVARPPLPPPPAGTGDLPGFFRGNALFLAKQRGARGGLTISDAPVSLCDVPASLYDAMEVSGVADCSSVFDANAPRGVRRFYAAVQDKNAGSHKNRLEFESYRIEGHAWHAQSWRRDMEPEPPAVHDAD
jgi:arylsulfatase A-like enzyme